MRFFGDCQGPPIGFDKVFDLVERGHAVRFSGASMGGMYVIPPSPLTRPGTSSFFHYALLLGADRCTASTANGGLKLLGWLLILVPVCRC